MPDGFSHYASLTESPDPYERFCRSRQETLAAFLDWQRRKRPAADDIAQEVDGTASALDQLKRLGLDGEGQP